MSDGEIIRKIMRGWLSKPFLKKYAEIGSKENDSKRKGRTDDRQKPVDR